MQRDELARRIAVRIVVLARPVVELLRSRQHARRRAEPAFEDAVDVHGVVGAGREAAQGIDASQRGVRRVLDRVVARDRRYGIEIGAGEVAGDDVESRLRRAAVRRQDAAPDRPGRREEAGRRIQRRERDFVVFVRRGEAQSRSEVKGIHRLHRHRHGDRRRTPEGVVRRRPGGVAEQDLPVDHRVGEVLVVPELVHHDVERGGERRRSGQRRAVEERHALEDVARLLVHPLRPGEAEYARTGTEEQIEDLTRAVEHDGREAVRRHGKEVREEVGDRHVLGQQGALLIGGRRGRNRVPRGKALADERDGLLVGQRSERALIGIPRDVRAAVRPAERDAGPADVERPRGERGAGGDGREDGQQREKTDDRRQVSHVVLLSAPCGREFR